MMEKEMTRLTKILLSILMVLTCIPFTQVLAYENTSEPVETASTEVNIEEMTSDELFAYIMSISSDELDALYDEYPNLDDLMDNFTEEQKEALTANNEIMTVAEKDPKNETDTVIAGSNITLTGNQSDNGKHSWFVYYQDSQIANFVGATNKYQATVSIDKNANYGNTVKVYHTYYVKKDLIGLIVEERTDKFTIDIVADKVKAYVYVNGNGYSDEALEVLGIDKSTLDDNGYFPVGEIELDPSYLNGKTGVKTEGAPLINSVTDWKTLLDSLSNMNTQTLTGEYAANIGNHIPEYLKQAVGDVNYSMGSNHTALFYWSANRKSYGFDDQTVRYHLDLRFDTSIIAYVNGNNGITEGDAKDGEEIDRRTYISGSTAIEPRNLTVPDGYKLVGYYSDEAMTKPWIPGETIVTKGTTVYVKLAKMDDVIINYVAGVGGTVSPDKESFNPETGTPSGSTANASDGKAFDGWYSDAEYTKKVSDSATFTPSAPEGGWQEDSSFTYYAKFIDDEKTVTVNYYWNNTETKVAESTTLAETYKVGDTATATPSAVDGYTPSSDEVEITVSDDESLNVINFYYYKNVTLTAKSSTDNTYDGTEKSVSGYTYQAEIPQDVTFEGIEVSASGTNAGKYDAIFAKDVIGKLDTTSKYIVSETINGSLVINKRKVTLVSEGATKVYDGKPLTKTSESYYKEGSDHFVDGEISDLKAVGSITNVGETVNAVQYKTTEKFNDNNYDIQYEQGKLVVTAVTDKVTVTIKGNTNEVAYNSTKQSVSGYEIVSVKIGDKETTDYAEADFKYTGEGTPTVSGTSVGSYQMGLKVTDFAVATSNFTNVEFEVIDGSLTITPASVTVTVDNKTKKQGEADPTYTATVKGLYGNDKVEYTLSRKTGEAVGEYAIEATGDELQGNYKVEYVAGKLTITKKEEKKDDPTPTSTPTPSVNPGCPAGTEWNEDAKICQKVVVPVTPTPTVKPTPTNTPTPTATPSATPEATASAEPEKSAEPTASAETIVDPDVTPEVVTKGHWALINLIAAVVSVLLGVVLVLSKNKKDKDEDEEEQENEDEEEVKRHKRWKVVSVVDAILAVLVFIFTENMRLPMVLVDKWTMLMVLFAVVSVISLVLGRKYHEDEEDEEGYSEY